MVKNLPASAGNAWDLGLIPGFGRFLGRGNGNALQYSCLENPMDRGAWWAVVHGDAQSWTWLKWCSDWVGGGVGSEAGIRFPRQGSGTQLPLNWRFLEGRDYVFYSLTSEASFPSPLFITKQDPAGIDWLLDSRSLWGDMKESWMQEQQDHVCILGRPFWTSEGWTVTWRKKGAGWTCGQHG